MNEASGLVFEGRRANFFALQVGGLDHGELLDIETMADCRDRARDELEALTRELATGLACSPRLAAFGWLFTPDYRRPDDFQGLFGWFYLFAVAEALVESGFPRRACFRTPPPRWVHQHLRRQGFDIEINGPRHFRSGRVIAPLRAVWHVFLFAWRQARELPGSRSRRKRLDELHPMPVLFKMPPEGPATRYGPLTQALSSQGWQQIDQNFEREGRQQLPEHFWRLAPWSSPARILLALVDALTLKWHLARYRTRAARWRDLVPVFEPSLHALARRMLQRRLWQAALRAGPPRAAVVITSLTRPEDRLLITCLKQFHVPVALVLPRPLNPDRPAERLLDVDLSRPETLPDRFIVRDGQSRDELIDQGVDGTSIDIAVPNPATLAGPEVRPFNKRRLLVLLTVLESADEELCRIIADALGDQSDFEVIVRPHPNRAPGPEERRHLDRFSGGWLEDANRPIGQQAGVGSLAVTTTSTVAIEAAREGAVVVWAPFLSEIALFQERFMQVIGTITRSSDELTAVLQALASDAAARADQGRHCHQTAHARFAASRSIAEALLDWFSGLHEDGRSDKRPNPVQGSQGA